MKFKYPVVLLLSVLFSMQSIAGGINFVQGKSWKEVLALAKKQNKLIFLDAYAVWCGPCKYLQKNVFTDDAVGNYYNKSFINVAIDMEEGEGINLAERYGVTSYPTLFFINGDGELVHKVIGAMDASDFLSLGKDAVNPEKQFYTIKKKARQGNVSPKVFHDWIHSAEQMEDEDLQSVLSQYLAKTSYPVMEEEMVSIIMDHATLLSKAQLDIIYKNKTKVAELLGQPLDKVDQSLVKLVAHFATDQSNRNGTMDFASFKKTLEGYYPDKAALETQKAKVSYYVGNSQSAKALEELTSLIQASYKVPVADMAMAVIDATNIIYEAQKTKDFVQKVQNFKVRPEEKELSYYKDMALLMLHYRVQDNDKVKFYVDKLLKDPNVPEALVEMIKSFNE